MIERDSEKDRFLDDLQGLCCLSPLSEASKGRDLPRARMPKDKQSNDEEAKISVVQVSGIK